MPKLTKKTVDTLRPQTAKDVFAWDAELRGFGVRVKPSGVKTYLIQYRNSEGRTRRLVLGKHGVLTPEQARQLAVQRLAAVARGEDPSADRHAAKASITVSEVCDWYLEEARCGRLLGRKRRPIKPSTLYMDESRIRTHIKPLLGSLSVRRLTGADIERMQADITSGRTRKALEGGRGRATKGGAGAAGRSVGTLRSLLGHAKRLQLIESNPAEGVRQVASRRLVRRLSREEVSQLGRALEMLAREGEHPVGLAAIRLLLLTGFRRMEALGLRREWLHGSGVQFPDTKSGPQVRVIGAAARAHIDLQPMTADGFIFPSDRGEGHFIGVTRVLQRVASAAGLAEVTPHVLRHTFASIAAELGYSELTIAGLLGHTVNGVTQRYVQLDAALVSAADGVADGISALLACDDVMERAA